jgi:hypothetical protein
MTLSPANPPPLTGEAYWVLQGPDGEIKDFGHSANVITDIGDRAYAENGAGVAGAPAVPITMILGTGTTAPTKSGAASTLITPIAGSAVTVTKGASAGTNARTITFTGVFGAGVGTSASPITEAVLTNASTGTAAAIGNTISRLLLSPAVAAKGALDTLTVTWLHNLGSP